MTEEILTLCRKYVFACRVASTDMASIRQRLVAALLAVLLRRKLNRLFARDYSAAEMWHHCNVLIEVYQQLQAVNA